VEVTNLSGEKIEHVIIRPLSKRITAAIDGDKVKFTIDKPAYVSVEIMIVMRGPAAAGLKGSIQPLTESFVSIHQVGASVQQK
jgi:hypothetical protein